MKAKAKHAKRTHPLRHPDIKKIQERARELIIKYKLCVKGSSKSDSHANLAHLQPLGILAAHKSNGNKPDKTKTKANAPSTDLMALTSGWSAQTNSMEFSTRTMANKGFNKAIFTGGDKAEATLGNFMNLKTTKDNQSQCAESKVDNGSKHQTRPFFREVLGGVPLGVKHRHKRRPLVYRITSPSGKCYIGQTCWWTQRMWKHRAGKSKCPGLNAAVKKYGWEAMTKEVLWEGPEEELNAAEARMIEMYDSVNSGYNCMPGGGFNPVKVPEILEKMRAGWASGDTRAKQKAGFTPEVRKRMSESQKARCRKDGNKQVREAAAKGQKAGTLASMTPEAKAKARATRERTRQIKAAGLIAKGRRSTAKKLAGNLRANS